MSAERVERALAALPHTGALAAEARAELARAADVVERRAGETVFLAGDPARAFFVVLAGAVRLYRSTADGRVQVVNLLGAGASFAEVAAFDLGRYPVACEARRTPTELVRVPAAAVRALVERDPAAATAMLGGLSRRMLSLVERVEELQRTGADARLAHWLLRQPGRPVDGGYAVELAVPKKDLAAQLGIAPETLSRRLARWRAEGVVAVDGARLTLRDLAALERLAGIGES